MWKCPLCKKNISDESNFCVDCKIHKPKHKPNYCTNPECRHFTTELASPTQEICDNCGALSTVGKEIDKYC